jgi:beta-galactosidase/beta-glucuronidase
MGFTKVKMVTIDFLTNMPKRHREFGASRRNHPSIVMWSSGNEVPDQWEKQV